MWESENQDESPLMTTDNFHGIDRLGGLSVARVHPKSARGPCARRKTPTDVGSRLFLRNEANSKCFSQSRSVDRRYARCSSAAGALLAGGILRQPHLPPSRGPRQTRR